MIMETKTIQITDRGTVLNFEIAETPATDTLSLLLDVAGMIFDAGYTLPSLDAITANKGTTVAERIEFAATIIYEEVPKVAEYFAIASPIKRNAIFEKLAGLITLRKTKSVLTGSVAVGEIKSPLALADLYMSALKYQARDFFPESHSESMPSGRQTEENMLNM